MIPAGEVMAALILKLLGAAAGSALALVFVPPRTMRGFFRRVTASLVGGLIFGGFAKSMAGFSDDTEGVIAGACLAAFLAWWIMGAALRILKAYKADT